MKELIINVCDDCNKIATLEDGVLVDYQIEFKSSNFNIGDIFLGRIKSKPKNLEAFFVDLNSTKDGFLHIDDFGENSLTFVEFYKAFVADDKVKVSTFKHVKEEEFNKNKNEKDDSIFIENKNLSIKKNNFNAMEIGSKTLVQVVKEPLFNKGARVSTRISIPGKYLVLIPFNNNVSISRKITNKDDANHLIKIITEMKDKIGLKNFGIILRTSALSFIDLKNEEDFTKKIQEDLYVLLEKWSICLNNLKNAEVGTKILDGDLRIIEILKDKLVDLFDTIYIDNKDVYKKIKEEFGDEYLNKKSIKLYKEGAVSLFAYKNVDKQIKLLLNKNVSFGENGYLIIEKTEAMNVIDVNSGKNTNSNVHDHEEMVFQTNLAALKEIVRQIRLRDMGGIIAIDFIDMKLQKNRDEIFEKIVKLFNENKSEVNNILPLSKFNVMLITRERVRPVIDNNINEETCPVCHDRGKIDSSLQIINSIEMEIKNFLKNTKYIKLKIFVHPLLYSYLTKGIFSKAFMMSLCYKKFITIDIDYMLSIFNFKISNKNNIIYKNF